MVAGKNRSRTEMAFGKVPAYCKYELSMERYRSASDFVRLAHRGRDSLAVLDVGCGHGVLKRFCDFGNIDWHGVDMLPDALRDSRALGYKVVKCDVSTEALPFDDRSFNVVVASHVVEHLSNREAGLAEMARTLRVGGLLIVGVPIKPYGWHYPQNLWLKFRTIPTGENKWQAHRWSTDLRSLITFLRRRLGKCFEVIDVRGFRFISGARRGMKWENHEGFYRFNVRFGKIWPALTREVNVVIRKHARPVRNVHPASGYPQIRHL